MALDLAAQASRIFLAHITQPGRRVKVADHQQHDERHEGNDDERDERAHYCADHERSALYWRTWQALEQKKRRERRSIGNETRQLSRSHCR